MHHCMATLFYSRCISRFITYIYTMLQKLSKCEVKASLCWNLIILPPLRFYVKSNYGESNQSKNVNFAILMVLNLDVSKFEQFFKSQINQNSKFRSSNIAKNDIFGLFEFTKSWFHVKSERQWNDHFSKVKP